MIFERTLELQPGGSETIENAFTTEPGKAYLVIATLERFVEDSKKYAGNYLAKERWEPNGFGVPKDATLTVTVRTGKGAPGNKFRPQITMS